MVGRMLLHPVARVASTPRGAVVGALLAAFVAVPAEAATPSSPLRPAHPAGPDAEGFRLRALAAPTRALSVRSAAGYLFTVRPEAATLMQEAGARPLLAEAGIWLVGARDGGSLRGRLLEEGWLLDAADNQVVRLSATERRRYADPLIGMQYAFTRIGSDAQAPPVPKARLFIIDSGIDPGHVDFADKANLELANAQAVDPATADDGEWHGTAVASIAAAQANGSGIEGVFPGVSLGVWDAGALSEADIVAGIRTAVKRGYDVVNMSFGSFGASLPQLLAIDYAHRRGLLLVAAAGNEFRDAKNPNPDTFPALFPHVLTVTATDAGDLVAPFSNRKDANDLSAPGVGVVAAIPAGFDLVRGGFVGPDSCSAEVPAAPGWCTVSGTSFAAPIVAAAATWIWSARPRLTNDQLFNLLRFSARDVGKDGFERSTGFGVVSIPEALRRPAPADDPQEPNEDIGLVNGALLGGRPNPLILPAGRRVRYLDASLDFTEDPIDVYRVAMPRGGRLQVTLRARQEPVFAAVFRPGSRSVGFVAEARPRDILGAADARRTKAGRFVVRAGSRGVVYVAVGTPRGSGGGEYRLQLRRLAG